MTDERAAEILTLADNRDSDLAVARGFMAMSTSDVRTLLAAREEAQRLREALCNLVKINEAWNDAVQSTIGRRPGWCDSYLDEARQALSGDAP